MESLRDKIQEWNIDLFYLLTIESQDFDMNDEFFSMQWIDEKEPAVIYSWNGISQDFYDYCDEHHCLPTDFGA